VKKSEKGLNTPDATEKSTKATSPTRAGKNHKNPNKMAAPKKSTAKAKSAVGHGPQVDDMEPIMVKHQAVIPDGLPKKYFSKSTFNTHDIMHAPVEKTLQMLDKILSGERLFTM